MSLGDRSTTGANRVVRGGSWINNGRNVRSAYRNHNAPDKRNDNLGFRLARAQRTVGMGANDQIAIRSVRAMALAIAWAANTRVRGAEVAGRMPRETPPRDRPGGNRPCNDRNPTAKPFVARDGPNRINSTPVGACLQANRIVRDMRPAHSPASGLLQMPRMPGSGFHDWPRLSFVAIAFACKLAAEKSSLAFLRLLRFQVKAERLHA